ncbi:MAG TPA: PDZ domain-containing protein, partial [Bacteroidetes bacterium]|nr:PDZ domain-containing protein [Bacteroidota bacterium]
MNGNCFFSIKMNTIMKSYLTMLTIALLGGMISLGGYKLLVEEDLPMEIGFVENRVPGQLASDLATGNVLPDLTVASAISTPAVVHVKSNMVVNARQRSYGSDPFGGLFGGPSYRQQNVQATGSGVITSPDGYIVTNNHVIKGAETVEVVLEDGRSFDALVVGTDPSSDIALLKIEEKGLPYLSFGSSDALQVGEWVLAVGNPFNLTSTVTAGIVSAKARNIHILKDRMAVESFIQTDAAVNPGNSGGALVNARGELVGINTAIASQTGSYSGYSFAVPAEIAQKVIGDLMTHGVVQRAFLGINAVELNGAMAKRLGVSQTQGVFVEKVVGGGSADKAGIQPGDVIVDLDNKSLRNAAELTEYVGRKRPGDEIQVTLLRNKKKLRFSITLRNFEGTTDVVRKPETRLQETLGAEIADLRPEKLRELNLRGGVEI